MCLTHADRLYAEIMAQKNSSKDKLELSKRYIRSELTVSENILIVSIAHFCFHLLQLIKERLGHSPSRDVDFIQSGTRLYSKPRRMKKITGGCRNNWSEGCWHLDT